jgi:hypothetical protein
MASSPACTSLSFAWSRTVSGRDARLDEVAADQFVFRPSENTASLAIDQGDSPSRIKREQDHFGRIQVSPAAIPLLLRLATDRESASDCTT